jgi:hypothetical protein
VREIVAILSIAPNCGNVHTKDRPSAVRVAWREDGDTTDSSLKLEWAEGEDFKDAATMIVRSGQASEPWTGTNWGDLIERYPPLLSYTAFAKILQGTQLELFGRIEDSHACGRRAEYHRDSREK